jgi:nucleoside-diphosphate-sugar epimerase
MKVILFGATGMVGQGVLRECLLDAGVESVLAVGRSPTGQTNAKLREIVHDNFSISPRSNPNWRVSMRASSASASLRSA